MSEEIELKVSSDIFLRPTPWKVSFQADWAWLTGQKIFGYVYLPEQFASLHFSFWANQKELSVINGEAETVWHTPIMAMAMLPWVLFHVESIVGGWLWRVWEYRWTVGVLTRRELQDQFEVLSRRLRELEDRQQAGR